MVERILVVDDEPYMLELLARILREQTSCQVDKTQSPRQALEWCSEGDYDLALVDLKMPEMDGLELLGRLNALERPCPVIIVTAYGTIRSSVQAMKQGAADFITKPFVTDEIILAVERALRVRRLERENRRLRAELEQRLRSDFLLGESPQVRRLAADIGRVAAAAPLPVLIEGEVGTGRELVARLLHLASPRAQGPLVSFLCGGLSPAAAEAQLFGGAGAAPGGLVAEAAGGTLYLAGVDGLSAAAQARLARLLEEGRYEPAGGGLAAADCRLVASTAANLEEEAASGRFSPELFFRLSALRLALTPLRERPGDIPLLAGHIIGQLCARYGRAPLELEPDALEWLLAQPWPGNVRELKNVLERAVVLAAGGKVAAADLLPSDSLGSVVYSPEAALFEEPLEAAGRRAGAAFGRLFEAEYLRRLLRRAKGDLAAAAAAGGLDEDGLRARLAAHGLPAGPPKGALP